MCITDKAKETSSCADLFRCGAASVCLDCRMFALLLGASVSLIRLPRCYYYTTCKWCMVSHLSSDAGVLLALVPWLPCAVRAASVAAGCVREPGLAVCPALLARLCPCGLVLWGCALPCGLGLCVGLVYRPLISPCYMGLFCGLVFRALYGPLKKMLYFRLVFRLCISGLFSGFVFALKFPARFSGPQRLDFFLRIFSRRFFRRKFPGYFFRALFSGIFPGLIFAAVSGFLFFLDVIFIRFPVLRDEFFHVVKFQELVHGGLVDPVALAF